MITIPVYLIVNGYLGFTATVFVLGLVACVVHGVSADNLALAIVSTLIWPVVLFLLIPIYFVFSIWTGHMHLVINW